MGPLSFNRCEDYCREHVRTDEQCLCLYTMSEINKWQHSHTV